MPDSSPVTVALVGYGHSGSSIHRPLIESVPDLSLHVVVARDPARVDAATRDLPQSVVTTDVRHAANCDVVVLAIPPAQRAGLVEQLLVSGAHVIVEKPLAVTVEEAIALDRISDDRLAVFHNRRWDADFLTLQRLRHDGVWSTPAHMVSRTQWWQPTIREGWRNEAGGGILLEVGTHLIDQALTLLGPVARVYAELPTRRRGAHAEDDMFLSLDHLDGSRSHLVAGPLGPAQPRAHLSTPNALVSMLEGDVQQSQLAAGLRPGCEGWGTVAPSTWELHNKDGVVSSIESERGRWEEFYRGVAPWVRWRAAAPVSSRDGVATMRVIAAARASARDLRVVEMESEASGG